MAKRKGQSKCDFAYMIGVSVGTLQNWEQGRRNPEAVKAALTGSNDARQAN